MSTRKSKRTKHIDADAEGEDGPASTPAPAPIAAVEEEEKVSSVAVESSAVKKSRKKKTMQAHVDTEDESIIIPPSTSSSLTTFPEDTTLPEGEEGDGGLNELKGQRIHRFQISDYIPSPIKAIACDPFSEYVAIGRENGEIEVYNSEVKWFLQCKIPGQRDFQLSGLQFSTCSSEKGRLFGISLRGFVFEVSLQHQNLIHVQDSYGGTAWCLALNCPKKTSTHSNANLAIGCEDGTLRIFNYGNGKLEYERVIHVCNSRVLSVAYHPLRHQILAGTAEGSLRCMNENNGSYLYRLNGNYINGQPAQFWSILVLSNSTIVTGDQRGCLQFWDGENETLLSSIQQHSSTILALATDPTEKMVFASGVDNRITCSILLSEERQYASIGRVWVHSSAIRSHSHDVNTLAIRKCSLQSSQILNRGRGLSSQESNKSNTSDVPILISGGVDAKLGLYLVEEFSTSRPFWIMPITANSIAKLNESSNFCLVKHQHSLDLWKLRASLSAPSTPQSSAATTSGESFCSIATRIQFGPTTPGGVRDMAISDDGRRIAALVGNKLYIYNLQHDAASTTIVNRCMIDISQHVTNGVVYVGSMVLSKDGSLVAVSIATTSPNTSSFATLDLTNFTSNEFKPALHILSTKPINSSSSSEHTQGVLHALKEAVSTLKISSNNQYLAVSSGANNVEVYDLVTKQLHWTIPTYGPITLNAPISCVEFHPVSHECLVILYANNTFLLVDVAAKELCPWSKECSQEGILPPSLERLSHSLVNITFSREDPSAFVLYGQNCFAYVNIDQKIYRGGYYPHPPAPTSSTQGNTEGKKTWSESKRRRIEEGKMDWSTDNEWTQRRNFAPVKAYKSIVALSMPDSNNIVLIENPWVKVLEALPATLARKRYGAK